MRRRWSALLGSFIVLGLAADVGGRHEPASVDFHTYLAAARIGLQHGWSDIYDQGLVAIAQKHLAPSLYAQPFLSTPPVAWVVSWLTPFPYWLSYTLWAVVVLGIFAAALVWSTSYRGPALALAVGAAMVPWFVVLAVYVGQIAPLIAAAVLVSWRLLRDDHDVAAGVVLVAILLKPNTAILAPLALLAAGRLRSFAAWFVAALVVLLASMLAIGPHGTQAYLSDLTHLPSGASSLTLHDAFFGLSGVAAAMVRAVISVAAIASAYRLRSTPGLALAAGLIGSLLIAPYLHGSDLCVLVATGWIIWHERPTFAWRAWLVVLWLLASPFMFLVPIGMPLNRWPYLEVATLVALVVVAWDTQLRWATRREAPLTS